MKKIGILTIHNSTNFGANLQAYALNKYLNDVGYDTETIDYIQPITSEHSVLFVCRLILKNYVTWGKIEFIKTFLKLPLIIKERKPTIKLFDKFRKKYLPMSKEYNSSNISSINYDNIVIGSDQVWNPNITRVIDKIYFAQGCKCNNIITYAASIGRKKYNENDEILVKEYSNNFNNISVREYDTGIYLSKLLDRNIDVVCDPVFLLDKEEYNNLLINSILKENIKYVLIYTVVDNENVYKLANNLKERYGYKIIQISNNKINNDEIEWVQGGPLEFLYLFKNARYIITNSFHGTAFSIIFEKEFYVVDNKERGSRITNLLKIVGLENRMVENNIKDYSSINYEQVNNNLKPIIEHSQNYLKENIK